MTIDQQRELFIRFLLDGKREISDKEISERQKTLGLNHLNPPFIVMTVAPDLSRVKATEFDKVILDFYDFVVGKITADHLNAYPLLNSYYNIQILLSLSSDSEKNIEKYCKLLREEIWKHCFLESFIGIGSIVNEANKIYISSADSRDMLGYRYQYGENGVISASNIVQFKFNTMLDSDIIFERVIGCFLDCNLGKMATRLDELVEHIRNRPDVSKTSIRRIMIELTVRIINIASNANIDVDSVLGNKDIYHWILNQGHTEVITAWIMEISSQFVSQIIVLNSTNIKKTINKACIFIERNLSKNELTLQTVSDYVGLTPQYFSQLFKKEKGIGFRTFIINKRVERAKHLLEQTELDVGSIALQTGHTRVQYFISTFAKHVGMSPAQYRKNLKKL